MVFCRFSLVSCAVFVSHFYSPALGIHQKYLPDLRRFRVEGVVGRFAVNRSALEKELQDRKKRDSVCGQEVKLEIPHCLPYSSYDISHQGEVLFVHEIITDLTLAAELPPHLREQIATSYHFLSVAIPVIIGKEKQRGLISVKNVLTNSTRRIHYPYLTSVGQTNQVYSTIVGDNDGTMNIQSGDDVMVYQVKDKVESKTGKKVGKDFDKVSGKVARVTSYPFPFDWGCQYFGEQISFCQVLGEFECELKAVGGDVCTLSETSTSERYPTSMKIINMTGIFRDMFPYLAETVPSESVEAEIIDRIHTTGIAYPCLE